MNARSTKLAVPSRVFPSCLASLALALLLLVPFAPQPTCLEELRSDWHGGVAQQSFAPTVVQHAAVLLLLSDVAQNAKPDRRRTQLDDVHAGMAPCVSCLTQTAFALWSRERDEHVENLRFP